MIDNLNSKNIKTQYDINFYKDKKYILESALEQILEKVNIMRRYEIAKGFRDPVEHCKGRIKSEESMIEKLQRKGLEVNLDNAINKIHDAVGVRIVCNFIDDVYNIVGMLKKMKDIKVIKEKDYIKNPKQSGYRSYHIIISLEVYVPGETKEIFAEIQIRTIAMDCWASLEHQLKYKHDVKNEELVIKELRRCADEMASTDLTMQTIRQMINNEI